MRAQCPYCDTVSDIDVTPATPTAVVNRRQCPTCHEYPFVDPQPHGWNWIVLCPHSHEPNAETIQALEDSDKGIGLTSYASVEDMFADLKHEDTPEELEAKVERLDNLLLQISRELWTGNPDAGNIATVVGLLKENGYLGGRADA